MRKHAADLMPRSRPVFPAGPTRRQPIQLLNPRHVDLDTRAPWESRVTWLRFLPIVAVVVVSDRSEPLFELTFHDVYRFVRVV